MRVPGWPAGLARVILDEIDSTNEEARRRAGEGLAPAWIMARRQTAGRGRQGRAWSAPAGNLAATLLLATARRPAEIARWGFHAALAVADLFAAVAPGVPVQMKWPNDALLGGAKAAGILIESYGPAPGGGTAVGIGIGVNLAHHPNPSETRWRPTSVLAETGRAPDPEAALGILADALARWMALDEAEGFAPVRAAWMARAARLGETIEVMQGDRRLSGRFVEVDADGALVLSTAGGTIRITAADVYFPA